MDSPEYVNIALMPHHDAAHTETVLKRRLLVSPTADRLRPERDFFVLAAVWW
jgi:hypothetical protein